MSWDRDEAASLLELMGTLTERMRDLADIFAPMNQKEPGDGDDPLRTRVRSDGIGIDVESIKQFTEAVRGSTSPVIQFGKSLDALADKIGLIVREHVNIGSAGGFRPPSDADNARPATGQRQYPDEAPAAYYQPDKTYTKPNLPDGMYTPIRNFAQAEKWFLDKETASVGQAQAYINLRDRLTPDIEKYVPLIAAGFDPKEVGKLAYKDAKDALLTMAQQATKVPANVKPRKVPKLPYMTRSQRLGARVAKGVFWGGTTGGLRGAVRGGIMGAGYNLFTNPAAVGAATGFAMPKIMEMTAMQVDRQIDANRRYAAFAPETMQSLVNYDIHNLYRGMSFARETSETAVNLIEQQDATAQAMQPYEIAIRNVGNTLGTVLSSFTGRFFQQSASVWNDINDFVTSEGVQSGARRIGKELLDTGVGAASLGAAVWLLSFLIPPVGALTAGAAFIGGVYGLVSNLDNPGVESPERPRRHVLDNIGVAPKPRVF